MRKQTMELTRADVRALRLLATVGEANSHYLGCRLFGDGPHVLSPTAQTEQANTARVYGRLRADGCVSQWAGWAKCRGWRITLKGRATLQRSA